MAIAFDAATELATGTGELSNTHTPVGTPRAALVYVVQHDNAVAQVTGVTYGGTAMAAVDLSPLLGTLGTEDAAVYGYFLGSSIPTGAQTVTVSVDGTGSTKSALVFTATAAADTQVADTSTLTSASVANPSLTLDITTECFITAAIHSGTNDPANIAPGTDYTSVAERDFTPAVASFIRRTNNGTSGAVTVDWVVAADEAHALAVAIREIASNIAGPLAGGAKLKSLVNGGLVS